LNELNKVKRREEQKTKQDVEVRNDKNKNQTNEMKQTTKRKKNRDSINEAKRSKKTFSRYVVDGVREEDIFEERERLREQAERSKIKTPNAPFVGERSSARGSVL